MATVEYAFMDETNNIINICVVDQENSEVLDLLKNHYEASYTLLLDEVGQPSFITDTWDNENSRWIVTEIPAEIVPTDITWSDEPNPNTQEDPLL